MGTLPVGGAKMGTLPGTPLTDDSDDNEGGDENVVPPSQLSERAGDRGRTGDVQLGKLAFYR